MASNNFDEERDIGLEEGLGFEDYNFTPNRPRTKRRQFTPAFKTDIIKRIDEGESVASISRKEEIHPSNIFRWIENKEALFRNVAFNYCRRRILPSGVRCLSGVKKSPKMPDSRQYHRKCKREWYHGS
jgi:hypothetical protein